MISNINIYLNVFLYIFDVKTKKISKIVMFVYVYNTSLEVKIQLWFSGRGLLHSKQQCSQSFQTEVIVFGSLLLSLNSRAKAVNQLK